LIRVRDEEHGAVLAIVAISFICLIGMLVLTFDLGRGVALKRNMVNAADAGALAAARECGLANGRGAAENAAGDLVADNNSAATVTGFRIDPSDAQCSGAPNTDPNNDPTVTVTVTVPQDYFFAPIFGINNGTVVASATATWETGVTNPVPLKLDVPAVEECITDENGLPRKEFYDGPECYFEFENELTGTGSARGWLNLANGWPVQGEDSNPMAKCSKADASTLRKYIDQIGEGDFSHLLWNPAPTYVCDAGGVPNTVVQAMVDWIKRVADMPPPTPVVYFPTVACEGTTLPCYPWIREPTSRFSYPVVGFVGFRVEAAEQGNPKHWPDDMKENCHFESGSSDVFCVHLSVVPLDGQSLGGAVIVRLVG
jgi:Flp pilus assembly protein TadG